MNILQKTEPYNNNDYVCDDPKRQLPKELQNADLGIPFF